MNPILAQQAIRTEQELVLMGSWAPWVQWLVAAAVLAVLALTIYNYRDLEPRPRQIMMVGLRCLGLAGILALFFQPALLEQEVARGRNHVLVLVDTSMSMALPHGGSERVDLVRDFIERNEGLWEQIREEDTLVFHAFGDEVRELSDPTDEAFREELKPRDRATDITGAIRELGDRYRNRDVGAMLVLTDGIDTTSSGRRAALDPATRALVRDLDAPIYAFDLPRDGLLKDIAVEHVAHNSFAFLLNATTLEATLRVHGVSGRSISVRLLENGREVSRKMVRLVKDQSHYAVEFEISPRRLGKHVYTVVAERLPDEVYLGNNVHEMVINVIRDKIRVLQIVGQPSWDERYLRDQLKQDPNIDLISFFILVNPLNLRPLNASETALIPFPAQELFEEELGGFDLCIFQNFNYGPFRTRQYLPNLAQYIRDGGGFLMIGGPLSFSSGGYYGTPITRVLPVDIPPGFGEEPLLDTRPFRVQLTDTGSHHPITRLALDPGVNAQRWGETEELEGMNLITQAKPDAVTLLEHPRLRDQQGRKMAVVAVREVGEGRSMAVMTDSTWHWSFLAGNRGGDPRIHSVFWSNAVRWLIKDPEMDLVRVRVLEERVPVGETAKATVQVFQPDYRPAANQKIGVTVRRRLEGAGAGEGDVIHRLDDARTNGEGVFMMEIPLDEAGIYEVEATATVVSGRVARASDLWVATERNPELERVVGDGRLLANLAEASGGSVQPLTTDEPRIDLRPPRVTRILNRRHVDLWTSPWVLLGLLGIFGTEWWLRRRFGFL